MQHDDCRFPSTLSILASLGLTLALVPACDEPEEEAEDLSNSEAAEIEEVEEGVEFRSGGCPRAADMG